LNRSLSSRQLKKQKIFIAGANLLVPAFFITTLMQPGGSY